MKKRVLTILCGIFFLGVVAAQGEVGVIENGSKVTLNYTLTVDDQVIDSSEGKQPLEYTQGQQMIIPGLEAALAGLKAGDTKKVVIPPEEAYGPRDEGLIIEAPKANLSEDLDPEVGMVLQVQNPEGEPLSGVVTEIKEETLTLDFNHPLAGKAITFDITIISVN